MDTRHELKYWEIRGLRKSLAY